MRRILVSLIWLAALLAWPAAPASAQSASWLDGAPTQFNSPGGAVPTPSPELAGAGDPRCAERARTPSGAEESAVAAAGYRLFEFWPTLRVGNLAVVVGTAGYDGMCRPAGYQGFVFAGGRFAGRLTPEPMISRLDGALASAAGGTDVRIVDGRVEARFVRYAQTDPLCCPSRGHTRAVYRVESSAVGARLAVESLVPEPSNPSTTPVQLPRTGGVGAAWPIALGLVLVGAAVIRR